MAFAHECEDGGASGPPYRPTKGLDQGFEFCFEPAEEVMEDLPKFQYCVEGKKINYLCLHSSIVVGIVCTLVLKTLMLENRVTFIRLLICGLDL